MTQLILDTNGYNISLPESRKNGYRAYKEDLGVEVVMVNTRLTKEIRGSVWHVIYQYGYFDDETKNLVISACEKGKAQSITCGFLPPNSTGALTYSTFLVVSFDYPKFMWSRTALSGNDLISVPMWGDFSLELREVRPGD